MNKLQTFAAKILGFTPVTERNPSPSPRSETMNLSSTATAATLQQAIRSAEKGDTKQLFTLYRDFVLGDDHVQGSLNTRKLAVLGQPISILPRNKNNPADVDAAAACLRFKDDCEAWSDGLAALQDSAAIWPVTICERIVRAADKAAPGQPNLQYTLRKLDPVPPAQICFKWIYVAGAKLDPMVFEPRLKLWPLDADGLIQYDVERATPLEVNRHIVHRGHLLSGFPDNFGGPGRSILGWILLRQLGRDWFARFMERYGSPFPKGKTNANDPQSVAFLQEAFSLATKIGGIVIGQDDEVELVSAVVQGGAEGHNLWIKVCNNAISRAITGYDESSNPSGLNAGESNKSENVRDDVRMFDQLKLAETLEKQVFAPLLQINGITGKVKVSFGGLSDADAKSFSDMVKTMKEAGYELTDESINTANERTGLTWQRAAVPAVANNNMDAAAQLATFAAAVVQNTELAKCPQCRLLVNIATEPEVSMGAVRCPKCKGTVTQANLIQYDYRLQPLATLLPPGVRLPKVTHPSDSVATEHAKAVGDAMREAFKPALKIIEDSRTPAECETRLAAFFADWRPKQFVTALEKPLQIAAAKGAVDAKK